MIKKLFFILQEMKNRIDSKNTPQKIKCYEKYPKQSGRGIFYDLNFGCVI